MRFKKKHAVERAYEEHSDAIFRFLYWQSGDQLLAEDLTSEVFIRAWDHAHIFESDEHNARAWMYTVARNLLSDHWRKKPTLPLEDVEEPISDVDVTEVAIKSEQHAKLYASIQQLDDRHKTIVILRFIEHLPVRQVADIMQLSEANVRTLQFRALKQLKKYLS